MPFQEQTAMQAKREFVHLALSQTIPMATLCQRFGISRQTGYKWVERYQTEGEHGLVERSRRPHTSPRQTDPQIERQVVQLRQAHPHWGGAKLQTVLVGQGMAPVPSGRTCTRILRRHGVLDAVPPPPRPWQRFEAEHPNGLVQIDFKGPIPLQTGRCWALSILDDHSRYLLGLRCCQNQTDTTVRTALTEIFRCYGLPWRILTDNGPPWGNPNQSQPLTRFSIWLLRLGIAVSHGRPFHPQTQGKVERFHRTLQLKVLSQPLIDIPHVERVFADWRTEYNTVRPHHALALQPPISRYTPSPRPFPEHLPPIDYADDLTVRTVKTGGQIQFNNRLIFVSQALAGERIALRPTSIDGVWQVQFCHQLMGLLDERAGQRPVVHFGPTDPLQID